MTKRRLIGVDYGTVRVGLPFLDEAARLLSKAGIKEAMIAGELYQAREDRRPRVQDVVSTAGRPTAVAELEQLRFAAFDLISLNGSPPPTAFRETWQKLTKMLASGTGVHPVEGEWINKPAVVRDLYARWVETEGAEGLVARSDAAGSFKIKPRSVGYRDAACRRIDGQGAVFISGNDRIAA